MTQSPAIVPSRPQVRRSSLAKRMVMNRLDRLASGVLEITDEGKSVRCGAGSASARITIHDDRFWSSIFKNGANGAAESWIEGWWTSDNLTDVLRIFAREAEVQYSLSDRAWLSTIKSRLWQAARSGSVGRAKQNIIDHYDLSNDFYKLWLDPSMTYSSGLFAEEETSLAEAQHAKYARMAEIADIQPGQHVMEIGTGWGGFAVHLAQHCDVSVTTTTISDAQYQHADALVQKLGLSDKITLLQQDYRKVQGTYDRVVSVEMIEAVGHKHLDSYFGSIERLLAPDGLVAIQAITIPLHRYKEYLGDTDFIRRYVFPGSCCPSLAAILDAASNSSRLRLIQQDDFSEDYAKTLWLWQQNFRARAQDVMNLGFDERFIRFWEYYLSYCEAGFRERSIGLSQLAFAASGNRSC